MYEFGVGALFAKLDDGSYIEFGTLQNTDLSISFDKKELYGRKQMPVHIARGKGKVEGKAAQADIKAKAINLILNGTLSAGQLNVAEPINSVIPTISPYTVSMGTLLGALNNVLIVYDTSGDTKVPMTLVDGTPTATDQYSFSAVSAIAGARIYTVTTNFAANDTITIDGVVFTAVASSASGNEFLVGSTIEQSITNLVSALSSNSTISSKYTITSSATTITLTETIAGTGYTPSTATVVGTGVVTSGTATVSSAGTGTFTFYSGDAGKKIQYQYDYISATGKTIQITNNMMGTAPTFEMEFYAVLDGRQIVLVLNKCTTDKLDFSFKNEDYMIPDFSYSAFADASDIIGNIYLNE
ncbi:hypothetical protein [Pectinatus frisingensis]|uniref:hypothetical protein n=1 Tax=Pectinatus frisingensis TaxID=865 RepID=UPI0018C834DE|nr:hypothetical protein [Pectinatus frisingensis]